MRAHGHTTGHPWRTCPPDCRHRQWVESYHAARATAWATLEAVTALYPADVERYLADNPLPALRDWMVHR